jgi:LacI family transcriptional regulator
VIILTDQLIMAKSASSLRDVAQAAGVSLATASRALNNKSHVQPETRALVLKAAADLGYKLQVRVAPAAPAELNTIGLLIKRDPFGASRLDTFYYEVLSGIEDECHRLGLNLMYASLPVDEYSVGDSWSPLLEKGDVDGLLIVGIVFTDLSVISRIPPHLPVVMVDGVLNGFDCDTITTDNETGAYHAVRYLIEQGHTRVALLGGTASSATPAHPSIHSRSEGYFRALAEHGIQESYVEECFMSSTSAYDATLRLLQRAPEITAMFCSNDIVAEQAVRAIRDIGLRVPDDISVIGFDDTEDARICRPPLTTIHLDKVLMGAIAVRQLHDRAANPNRVSIHVQMGTKLIVRSSVTTRKSHNGAAT